MTKEDRVTKETGRLIRWDDEKGFGFIRPEKGGDDLFLHIKELSHLQRRPQVNDRITYQAGMDAKGRPRAIQAKIAGKGWSPFTVIWILSAFVLAAYAVCVFLHILPFHFASLYVFMSILTIQQYSIDKGEARAGRWRTSEANLHFFELAGGWPGALFAQYFYRHKYRKLTYQIVFWSIVLIHGISWAWIAANPDMLNTFTKQIGSHIQARMTEARPDRPIGVSEPMPMPSPTRGTPVAQNAADPRDPITTKNNRRVVEGIITEVSPRLGIVVALPPEIGGKGMIDKATLNANFTNRFITGTPVQVVIKSISFRGSEKQMELEWAGD